MSIAELPVRDNVISFSARRTAKKVGWPSASYYLNGKHVVSGAWGIWMPGGRKRVLVAR